MTRLLRILNGAILGALLGLAVGTGFVGVVLLLYLPNAYPMDRWYAGVRIFGLVVGSSTLVGLVAGLASKACERGLPLLKSTMIVAIGGIVAIPFGIMAIPFAWSVGSAMYLLVPLVGVIVGGIAVVLIGMARSNAIEIAEHKGENTADKT